MLVVLAAGCSTSPEQTSLLNRDEIFDRIDQDDDGIALRADYETVVALSNRTMVVASYPGGDITIEAVLDSLTESPPSGLIDAENPSVEQFRARLTSMVRLRLAAVAIDEAGLFHPNEDGPNERRHMLEGNVGDVWVEAWYHPEGVKRPMGARAHLLVMPAKFVFPPIE